MKSLLNVEKYKVAIIGAGPAGLSCAARLNRAGVQVTVYDQSTRIGGLLQTGVPSFKLDKNLLQHRHKLLERSGIHFHLGERVDEKGLSRLIEQNHAVFLGLGAQKPRSIDLPGQQLPSVVQALDWLKRVNAKEQGSLDDQNVLILGGGDTAMDCARCARRFGADVTIAYRGPESRLRASPNEVLLAREEGVHFRFKHTGVKCEKDATASHVLFSTPVGASILQADLVILALGQQPDPPPWLDRFDIHVEPDGRIQVDDQGRTSHPEIWAGGDNTLGPNLAVSAMAAGRRAAEDMLVGFTPLADFRS